MVFLSLLVELITAPPGEALRAQTHRIVFFFDGVHEDYHRPGDEPQKIDYAKMEKVARTIYLVLWEVANRPARVKVDKQLPAQLQQ